MAVLFRFYAPDRPANTFEATVPNTDLIAEAHALASADTRLRGMVLTGFRVVLQVAPAPAPPLYVGPDTLWAYDKLQFARLIAEAEAAGCFAEDDETSPYRRMLDSMDLDEETLAGLIDRAQAFWDAYREESLRPQARPRTVAEAFAGAEDDQIEGVVAVELSDFVDHDLEGVLDLLGAALVEGGECLSGTSYRVVGQQGNTLYVLVSGDASLLFSMHTEEELT